jgi:hypothetical protein
MASLSVDEGVVATRTSTTKARRVKKGSGPDLAELGSALSTKINLDDEPQEGCEPWKTYSGKSKKGKDKKPSDEGGDEDEEDGARSGKSKKKGHVVKVKMEDQYGGFKRSKPDRPLKAKDRFLDEYIRAHAGAAPVGDGSPVGATASAGSGESSGTSSSISGSAEVAFEGCTGGKSAGGDKAATKGGSRKQSAGGDKAAAAVVTAGAAEDRRLRRGDALRAWAALPADDKAALQAGEEEAYAAYELERADWEEQNTTRMNRLRLHRQRP